MKRAAVRKRGPDIDLGFCRRARCDQVPGNSKMMPGEYAGAEANAC